MIGQEGIVKMKQTKLSPKINEAAIKNFLISERDTCTQTKIGCSNGIPS